MERWQPLGARLRGWRVRRPPWQVAMGAVAPERLEEDPVLEERPAAAGTGEARHAASRPGDRSHPEERHYVKRRVLEQQVVQQPGQQERSGETGEEQRPENRRSAIQVEPSRVERKTRGQRDLQGHERHARPAGIKSGLVCNDFSTANKSLWPYPRNSLCASVQREERFHGARMAATLHCAGRASPRPMQASQRVQSARRDRLPPDVEVAAKSRLT